MNPGEMVKRTCSYCGCLAWHNPMKESSGMRCTKCGTPVSNNPAKREYQETLRRNLAKRLT